MSKNVWLYIGTSSRTLMIPASRLRGIHPEADGTLLLSFDSIVNTINTPPDKVILNLFADNTHLDVMKAISRAIHNQTPTFGGFVTVADDTTSVGGGYDTGFFHVPEYLTDHDGTEAGKIASVNALKIQDATKGNLTATTAAAWANGTETPRAGVWIVSSDNAAKVIHLPPCHQGARVEYLCSGSGFKLRAEVTSDYINGATGEVEEVCPAGISRVRAYDDVFSELGYFKQSNVLVAEAKYYKAVNAIVKNKNEAGATLTKDINHFKGVARGILKANPSYASSMKWFTESEVCNFEGVYVTKKH